MVDDIIMDIRNAKTDNRPKRGWWAPGNYFKVCKNCGCTFIGDKRAGHCADCAYDDNIQRKLGMERFDPQI